MCEGQTGQPGSMAAVLRQSSCARGMLPRIAASAAIRLSAVPESISGVSSSAREPPDNHPAYITRGKHSATQTKRILTRNPARLRLLKKRGEDLKLVKIPPPSERTYPPIFQPTFLKSGWSAPPGSDVEIPEYPFRVERTGRKPYGAAGFLPVYRDVR